MENVVSLPHLLPGSIHRQITGYYNSIQKNVDREMKQTVREVVKKWDYDEQYKFGIETIKKF